MTEVGGTGAILTFPVVLLHLFSVLGSSVNPLFTSQLLTSVHKEPAL